MNNHNKTLILAGLYFCLSLLAPNQGNAFSEVQNYFLDSGVNALGRGGYAPIDADPEAMSLSDPLSLRIASSAKQFRLDTTYEYQRTLRLFSGRWQRSHAYSDTLETVAAVPFRFLDDNLKVTAAVGYASRWDDVLAYNEKEGIDLKSDRRSEAFRGGLLLSYKDYVTAAVSLDSNNAASNMQVPFEVKVRPIKWLDIGYRQSYFNFKHDISVTIAGKNGAIPLAYEQTRRDLYASARIWDDAVYLRMGVDPTNSDNIRGEGRIQLPYGLYLSGSAARQKIDDLRQDFSASDAPGGHIDVLLNNRHYRIGVGIDINERWNAELNYVHSQLDLNGGGIANARAVVDFWPSLVVGHYNYLYRGGIDSDRIHLGGSYRGENWSFQSGVQYLHLKPSFRLDYWRSGLFGIGRAGEGTEALTVDSVDIIGVFFGCEYKRGPFSIGYSVGQFIPFASHDSKKKDKDEGGGGSSGGGKNIFDQIADKFKHHPGGLIQRLQLTLVF